MMQRLSSFTLLFLILTVSLYAQKKDKKKKNDMVHAAAQDLENQSFNERDSMVFYHSKWEIGNLTLKNNKSFSDVPLLYDLERDQVEVLQEEAIELYGGEGMKDTTILIFEQHEILSFDFVAHLEDEQGNKIENPHKFVNAEIFERDELPATGIYEVIVEGKIGLIIFPYLLKTVHRTTTYYDQERMRREMEHRGVRDNRIDQNEVYYDYKLKERPYLLVDNNIIEIDQRKKVFLKSFDEDSDEVNQFIRDNNLQHKNKKDLIKILDYYNGLSNPITN